MAGSVLSVLDYLVGLWMGEDLEGSFPFPKRIVKVGDSRFMMNLTRPRIVAFMNAYSQGKSGGDMVFIETAKRLAGYDKVVVTSELGKQLCQESTVWRASF